MTLEQLKAILDGGGTIVRVNRGTEISRHSEGFGYYVGSKNFDWNEVAGILSNPSEWQEVKAEEQYVPHARFYAENRP